jgi:beta-galactosidase
MATKKNPNAPQWKADGMDLQHVTVTAVDSKGRRVLNANQEVTFAVEGPAEIVGVINGDITSNEMTVGNKRSFYNGSCSVILRSTRQAGPVTLTASVQGLKEVKLKMETK